MDFIKSSLWAPEIIMESRGIACGDKMTIHAYRENQKLFFSLSGASCSVAKKVAEYLENTYSGKAESEIHQELLRLREKKYKESEGWILEFDKTRKNCVESPVSLLYGLLTNNGTCEMSDRENAVLACDACVRIKHVNWNIEQGNKKEPKKLTDILKKVKHFNIDEEMKLQELGLCVLPEDEQKKFEYKALELTEEERKLVKKLRLASLYYNNAEKYNVKLDPRIEEIAVKQAISLLVSNEEIKVVNKYIKDNGLRIDAVKGGKTNKYYPAGAVRTHMDFDFLAASAGDAFYLIDFLINTRGFKLVIGGSVPFSFKAVLDENKNETLTGHIHLEKILQDRYQVVVDINMGGFPLGRTGIIKCNEKGQLEFEDLICITLVHLFKHEHAFIKDINDLYYLLNAEEVNSESLTKKLNKYGLNNYFAVAYRFLQKSMGMERRYPVNGNWYMNMKAGDKWPYSRKTHFYLKAADMLMLSKRQFGLIQGIVETKKQICGESGNIDSNKYKCICKALNTRTYLYPIIIFGSYKDLKQIGEFEIVDSLIAVYHKVVILPIGLFLMQTDSDNQNNRQILEEDVKHVFKIMEIGIEDCNLSYVMEARRDTWLY